MNKHIMVPLALSITFALSFTTNTTLRKCAWLLNNSFEICDAANRCTEKGGLNSQSAAANWLIHNDNQGRIVHSSVMDINEKGCDGRKMLKIGCQGNESGVYQMFKPLCDSFRVSASVRVWKGDVQLVVLDKHGIGHEYQTTKGLTKGWKTLTLTTTSRSVRVAVLNTDTTGGKFDIDYVCIEPIK